jgi:DNA-binding response OmpR family regulator
MEVTAVKTILVIEDEDNLLRLYRDELEECGYRVLTARNSADAFTLLSGEPRPDLITLDIKLEGNVDGIEVLRKIKELDSSIPVIINTAYSEFKSNFGVWASEDYVVKSSNLDELKERIAAILDPPDV